MANIVWVCNDDYFGLIADISNEAATEILNCVNFTLLDLDGLTTPTVYAFSDVVTIWGLMLLPAVVAYVARKTADTIYSKRS